MKKICFGLSAFLVLIQVHVQAILPPLYHTLSEFKALINDKQLTDKLQSGEAILSITLSESSFRVQTNQHNMIVDIVYEQTDRIGPAQFHLVFHEPTPR